MQFEHNQHKDEELMTDLQFLKYKRLSDELAEAKREIEMLRGNQGVAGEPNMSDYQFRRYEEYRDKCEAFEKERSALRQEKSDETEDCMTDIQFLAYSNITINHCYTSNLLINRL